MAIQNRIQKISLSEEDQAKIATLLDGYIEDAESFHSSWEDLHDGFLNQYLCKPEVENKIWPWPGSSNLFVPLARVIQDGILSQLHDAMFTNQPYMKVVGVEEGDISGAELLSLFY